MATFFGPLSGTCADRPSENQNMPPSSALFLLVGYFPTVQPRRKTPGTGRGMINSASLTGSCTLHMGIAELRGGAALVPSPWGSRQGRCYRGVRPRKRREPSAFSVIWVCRTRMLGMIRARQYPQQRGLLIRRLRSLFTMSRCLPLVLQPVSHHRDTSRQPAP